MTSSTAARRFISRQIGLVTRRWLDGEELPPLVMPAFGE